IPVYDLLNNNLSETIENTISKNEIIIYPNPVNKNSLLTIKSTAKGEFTISDLSGKIIKQITISNGINTIPTNKLESGVYLMKWNANGRLKTKKLIVK
ncbi:MAG: T9SS type A sorting domain-containing protein, partial [Parvicellaceae bacterium]